MSLLIPDLRRWLIQVLLKWPILLRKKPDDKCTGLLCFRTEEFPIAGDIHHIQWGGGRSQILNFNLVVCLKKATRKEYMADKEKTTSELIFIAQVLGNFLWEPK